MMKKAAVIFIIFIVFVALFLKFRGPFNKNKYVAQVNGVGIQQITYEKKLDESINFFKSQNQDIAKLTTLQKDTINKLVEESLINQYAEKNKISVSETEINARYLQVVQGYNRRNNLVGTEDSAFLSKINEMYKIGKSDYLLTVKEDILKEKVQTSVRMPLVKWLLEQKKSAQIKTL